MRRSGEREGTRLQRVRAWVRRMFREHRILAPLMTAYLTLSAVELTRILLYDGPRIYDAGLHGWESAPDSGAEGDQRRFRWTNGEQAYLLRPVSGAVLTVRTTLQRPDMPGPVVPVELELADTPLGNMLLDRNDWFVERWYVPPVLRPETWNVVQEGWRELRAYLDRDPERARYRMQWYEELGPSPRRAELVNAVWEQEQIPDYVRVFTEWHRPPGPPSVWLHVRVPEELTFVPAELMETDDDRELGVGIALLEWSDEVPAEGLGFYPWERAEAERPDPELGAMVREEFRYRWTRRWASLPVNASGAAEGGAAAVPGLRLKFRLRSDHPDLASEPLEVRFFWGSSAIGSMALEAPGWRDVRLDVPAEVRDRDPGPADLEVLSLFVSRTWNPFLWNKDLGPDAEARAGDPADKRYLGVAITEVEVSTTDARAGTSVFRSLPGAGAGRRWPRLAGRASCWPKRFCARRPGRPR